MVQRSQIHIRRQNRKAQCGRRQDHWKPTKALSNIIVLYAKKYYKTISVKNFSLFVTATAAFWSYGLVQGASWSRENASGTFGTSIRAGRARLTTISWLQTECLAPLRSGSECSIAWRLREGKEWNRYYEKMLPKRVLFGEHRASTAGALQSYSLLWWFQDVPSCLNLRVLFRLVVFMAAAVSAILDR